MNIVENYQENRRKFMFMGFAIFIVFIMGISMVSVAFATEVSIGDSITNSPPLFSSIDI